MKNRTRLSEKIIIRIVFVIFILVNVLPVIVASAFTTVIGDDFDHFATSGISADSDIFHFFRACLKQSAHFYMTWGGVFFSIFINLFFSPLGYFKGQPCHLFMVFNAVFICAAFLYFVIVYWKYLTHGKPLEDWLPFLMAGCGIFTLVNYDVHQEIFFWFTGATAYGVPEACILLSLALLIRFKQCRRNSCFAASCLIGFLAMGGSSAVAGTGCFLCLLVCAYEYLKNSRIEKSSYSLFALMFAGALINVVAPGNYVRQSLFSDSGLHPLSALRDSLLVCVSRMAWFSRRTGYFAILAMILMIGILIGKEQKMSKAYGITSAAALLLPVVTGFPVALGYGNAEFPNRILFVIDVSMILAYSNAALVAGFLIAEKLRSANLQKVICLGLGICALSIFCLKDPGPQNRVSYRVLQQLRQGLYQSYHRDCQELFNELSTQAGKDVVLSEEQFPQPISFCHRFYLSQDANYWENRSISLYFGLNSISLSFNPKMLTTR